MCNCHKYTVLMPDLNTEQGLLQLDVYSIVSCASSGSECVCVCGQRSSSNQ